MARPRKDGRAAQAAYRKGKQRITGTGHSYQVKAYRPTATNPHGRVVWLDAQTGKPRSRTPAEGETLDALFETIEAALSADVTLTGGTTMRHLGALYLDRLATVGRSDGYVANRKAVLNKWINPVVGDLLICDWLPDESERVLKRAADSGEVGEKRIQYIRDTLSGLRHEAHRRRKGGRLLSPEIDPLEDVATPKPIGVQGQSSRFVPIRVRPSTDSVEKAIAAATEVDTFDWMPECVAIGGYEACRLSEQLALRAVDVDFPTRMLDVNGAWMVERKADEANTRRRRWRRPFTKNGQRRATPFRESQRPALLALCRRALGLADDTPEEQVVAAIDAERRRRADATRSGDWRDHAVDVTREPWLFPDESGVPPTKERFNDEWHKVRDACGWDPRIPYKNLRHHAILLWKKLLPGLGWQDIAVWSGHDHRTLEAYYVIPAEDANNTAHFVLGNL